MCCMVSGRAVQAAHAAAACAPVPNTPFHNRPCKHIPDGPEVQSAPAPCCRRRVRVFWYASGRLRRVYDESLAAAAELQRSDSDLYRLDPIDFGRRVAAEKDLEADAAAPRQNALFDDSGNFIIYSTLLGIKVVACPMRADRVAARAHPAHFPGAPPCGPVYPVRFVCTTLASAVT